MTNLANHQNMNPLDLHVDRFRLRKSEVGTKACSSKELPVWFRWARFGMHWIKVPPNLKKNQYILNIHLPDRDEVQRRRGKKGGGRKVNQEGEKCTALNRAITPDSELICLHNNWPHNSILNVTFSKHCLNLPPWNPRVLNTTPTGNQIMDPEDS